jgi:hypothetical protein
MMTSGFCLDPISGTLAFFTSDTLQYFVVNYYLTACGPEATASQQQSSSNSNNLQSILAELASIFREVDRITSIFGGECSRGVKQNTNEILHNIQSATAATECSRVHSLWHTAVVSSVCQRGFTSLYNLLILQGIMLIFFYVMLWITSIVYQTFQLDETSLPKYEGDGDGEMKVEEGIVSVDAGGIELTSTSAQVVNAANISTTALYPGSNNLNIEPELHEVKLDDCDYVDIEV